MPYLKKKKKKKLGKMLNFSSAAVVIGALRVNLFQSFGRTKSFVSDDIVTLKKSNLILKAPPIICSRRQLKILLLFQK